MTTIDMAHLAGCRATETVMREYLGTLPRRVLHGINLRCRRRIRRVRAQWSAAGECGSRRSRNDD